jgi:hypothetical protein
MRIRSTLCRAIGPASSGCAAPPRRVKRYGNDVPALASDGERRLFSGSDAEIIGDIHALGELGVTAIDFDFERPEAAVVIADMRAFKERVLAKV